MPGYVASRGVVASMVAKITNPARAKEFGFANVLDPNTNATPLAIYAVSGGLILANRVHGFWFIPNDELRAAIAMAVGASPLAKSGSQNP